MNKVKLTDIRKEVENAGGTYKKLRMYLNGQDCYEVCGMKLTKSQMIDKYLTGEIKAMAQERAELAST